MIDPLLMLATLVYVLACFMAGGSKLSSPMYCTSRFVIVITMVLVGLLWQIDNLGPRFDIDFVKIAIKFLAWGLAAIFIGRALYFVNLRIERKSG